MNPVLIDTDTVSEILKFKNPIVGSRSRRYLERVGPLAFSAVTCYEVKRGLKRLGNISFLNRFDIFCDDCLVFPIDDSVLETASDLWSFARKGGHPCNDADLFIGATALCHDRVLATGNTHHYSWIPNLTLDNWRIDPGH